MKMMKFNVVTLSKNEHMLTINVSSLVKHSGLPEARSEISGPNVYKIL